MQKKGQVTLFVILGLVLLILISVFFYARSQYGFLVPSQQFLEGRAQDIQTDLASCVERIVPPLLTDFSQQGGSLNPSPSLYYHGKNVAYLCQAGKGTACVNYLPPLSVMLHSVEGELTTQVQNCVNKDLLAEKGIQVSGTKTVKTTLELSGDALTALTSYDVQLQRDTTLVHITPVRYVAANVPLGEIYPVIHDIIEGQTHGGFDQLYYMLQYKGKYLIQVDKPYPDTVYRVSKTGSDYAFWFAVQGAA